MTASPLRSPARPRPRLAGLLLIAAGAAGCATTAERAPGDTRDPRDPTGELAGDLPPIPSVSGQLDLRVSYPRDSAYVATRGENFIFGSAGTGDARVWINGQEVEVQPNGGFLAFLPVPEDSVYRLRGQAGGQVQTLEVPILLPGQPQLGDSLLIVPGSVYPTGGWVVLPDERIDIGFQGRAGGVARLIFPDGGSVPLVERREEQGGATDFELTPGGARAGGADPGEPELAWYRGFFAARPLTSPDTAVAWPALGGDRPAIPVLGPVTPPPPADLEDQLPAQPLGRPLTGDAGNTRDAGDTGEAGAGAAAAEWPTGAGVDRSMLNGHAIVEFTWGGETVREPLALNLVVMDPERPRVGVAYDPDPPAENGDGAIIARPGPGGGPYHYTWANGTELTLTGERNGILRVALADDLDVWSPAGDIVLRAAGTPPPASRVATVRMDPHPRYIDIYVALDRRLPYEVEESATALRLVVYGALSRVNFLQHGRTDPYIVRGEWDQPTNERFVLTVHTDAAPWGYETFWATGDDLVLRLRRPPAIDPARPLAGLTVGIDAGHGGADRFTMGPTGFTEADANLGIARALRDALEDRGARVVMTRLQDTTVTLVERTEMARRADVDLWLSVHNNAFPDGVNPWENAGTSVYYNHPRAASLAWSVQQELLEELRLRDIGVGRADLHQARFTWAPAILTENMFMMIPEQEAALKREDVQRRIAEAHVRGIADWLRAYARAREP